MQGIYSLSEGYNFFKDNYCVFFCFVEHEAHAASTDNKLATLKPCKSAGYNVMILFIYSFQLTILLGDCLLGLRSEECFFVRDIKTLVIILFKYFWPLILICNYTCTNFVL